MTQRVLFVDDDQMLLSSMERCLGLKFELDTAISGLDALELMKTNAYSVVVSDMRMPIMDGVQFIEKARVLSRQSVFMMLTGNQDLQTAMRAVNEGQVYRFLNKPCRPDEIEAAVTQAQRQFNLEASERELLNKTFVDALGVFSDVIETLQPHLVGRCGKTEQVLDELRLACGLPSRWEYKVAAKVMLLGFAMQFDRRSGMNVSATQATIELNRACTTAARIVQRIPRLDSVAEIIRCVPTTDGVLADPSSSDPLDMVMNGAALLRVAHMVEALSDSGVECDEAMTWIVQAAPDISPMLAEAARNLYPKEVEAEGIPFDPDDLKPGLILFDDLTGADGATLLRSGRKLSQTHIDKLRDEKADRGSVAPVLVTRASYLQVFPNGTPTATA
ncbi:Hydrogenase transcriptional regulatory protein hupR1 [Botrimarina colliarenosi]|uniref:Hydrogenase transcriptional regulatory protein hupR1 n=1 Tax=Botrimarina colliarenosi TaxID=2528001 RepID=A0A5C6AFA4_9BACT|nr:response regulator [Botrimarina colliarenosi]TWT97998.1 Hydrogenase transcriptional regulatory protein hupR1 [Botrimarina colliarenosi]